MGTLRDEVYESLDYLSQLTEVVIAPQNEVLASLPDRVPITIEMIKNMARIAYSYGASFGKGAMLVDKLSLLYGLLDQNRQKYISDIFHGFEFEATEGAEIDFELGTITGEIALVKRTQFLDEREILKGAVREAVSLLCFDWPKKTRVSRAVVVLNTLEPGRGEQWLASGAPGSPRAEIAIALEDVILNNKWRIRGYDVIVKVGAWINSYMSNGQDDLGLVNLVKLKFMLDKDVPVYSIEEVKKIVSEGEAESGTGLNTNNEG